jgi:hypothetical protein
VQPLVGLRLSDRICSHKDYLSERYHQGIGGRIIEAKANPSKSDATPGRIGCRSRLDSLELLREFSEAMPHALLHVVRNAHFGEEGKFELYNASKIRQEMESRGGRTITFPDLADRVADDIYTKRMSVAVAASELPIGNRAELARWRGEVRKALGEVLA